MKKLIAFCFAICFFTFSYAQEDLAQYVNPMVGTDFHGHTFPGAIVPFGAVQLSPDTRLDGWDGCSAYHYSDHIVYGFSHTHLSGTGCSDYGDVLLMPFTGKASVINSEYRSSFSHQNEKAEAGYYSVLLDKYDIQAELTCSKRVGVHRYTFPNKKVSKGIILDLKHRDIVLNSAISYDVKENKIVGLRDSKAWNENQKLNFSILFSQPIAKVEFYVDDQLAPTISGITGTNCKAVIYFAEDIKDVVVKVALSAASQNLAGADINHKEVADFNFDKVRQAARESWNKELGKIVVETSDSELKKNFYTALYHCFTSPFLFTDIDGQYRGMDGLVHKAKGHDVYTVFSLWDTYRALHPLLSIIDRQRTSDFIYTFMRQYEQGGMLPVWELSAYETWCMIGYHSIPVIWDAYQKGILDDYSDHEKYQVLEAMVNSAKLNRLGRPEFAQYRFIPAEMESESVSKTLEYAYDDWCIAQFAQAIGKDDVYQEFIKRAQAYKNVLDPDGFMHPKRNGGYLQPFNPREINNHYTEANSWQYSTYVPHDFNSYCDLIGGTATAERLLDTLFGTSSQTAGRNQADVTGLIGQYAHGNEPSHHAVYLYNYIGKPWKTQQLVNQIIYTLYSSKADGLCGNEDCGQMSAWYVLSAIGFYPVCPGDNRYIIGSPVFDKVTINLENGKQFVVSTHNRNQESCYIQSAKLNGKKFDKSYITYEDIRDGGLLAFEMGEKPNGKWGVGKGKQPESRIESNTTIVPVINAPQESFTDEMTVSISLFEPTHKSDAKMQFPAQTDQIYYTTDGSEPTPNSKNKYEKPFTIRQNTIVKAISYNSQTGASPVVEAQFYKFSQDKQIKLHCQYEEMYPASGDNALIDGIRGRSDFRLGGWQGYQVPAFEATIDLQSARDIHQVSVGFLQDTRAWIIYPIVMTVEISGNNVDFLPYGIYTNTVPADDYTAQKTDFTVKGNAHCRYIKIKATNYGTLPAWHLGAGGTSHIFVDEIVVE